VGGGPEINRAFGEQQDRLDAGMVSALDAARAIVARVDPLLAPGAR